MFAALMLVQASAVRESIADWPVIFITDGRAGLAMLLEGGPLDDSKGERELNEFAVACGTIRMDVEPRGQPRLRARSR